MKDKIGKILKVKLHNGKAFSAKLISVIGTTLVFENSKGETSFNELKDIYLIREVATHAKHQK